jgi:hypothetical protein
MVVSESVSGVVFVVVVEEWRSDSEVLWCHILLSSLGPMLQVPKKMSGCMGMVDSVVIMCWRPQQRKKRMRDEDQRDAGEWRCGRNAGMTFSSDSCDRGWLSVCYPALRDILIQPNEAIKQSVARDCA